MTIKTAAVVLPLNESLSFYLFIFLIKRRRRDFPVGPVVRIHTMVQSLVRELRSYTPKSN